jgi:predicted RND superfamily exporter protein
MSVVEDVRQVLQDFLAPELREIRGQLTSLDKRLDAIEEVNRVRFEAVIQRLEQIQQSFAFDKRISNLEDDKRRSA